jgi:hypothetical protein
MDDTERHRQESEATLRLRRQSTDEVREVIRRSRDIIFETQRLIRKLSWSPYLIRAPLESEDEEGD